MNKNKEKYQELVNHSFVSINGEVTTAKDAKISIFDRGFLYGDSIYEVFYTKEGFLVYLNEHLDRLYHSAKLLNIELFFERSEIIKNILDLLKHAKIPDAYIRLVVTRGVSEITLDPNASFENNVVIIVKPKPIIPKEFYSHGLHLAIASIERNNIKSTNPNAKSGNYLNNVMAIGEAKEMGADDALMINSEGMITEGPTFNVWMVKDGKYITPPVNSGILKGITRDKILSICKSNNLPHKIESFTPDTILAADEVFITSSTRGIIPVRQINHRVYGATIEDWPHTSALSKLYQDEVNKELQRDEYKFI